MNNMKKLSLIALLSMSSGLAIAATAADKVSYSLGFDSLQQLPAEIKRDAFIQGLMDAQASKKSIYTEAEITAAGEAFQKEIQAKQKADAAAMQAQSTQFFASNAKKKGVKTTVSGLQYKIDRAGTGKRPSATDTVKVHYKGQLLNGKVFDSSYERGEPIEFPLNQVITGWTEGLQLLKAGGKITLYIPAQLAYGEQSTGGIPANSPLIFDVELLEVK